MCLARRKRIIFLRDKRYKISLRKRLERLEIIAFLDSFDFPEIAYQFEEWKIATVRSVNASKQRGRKEKHLPQNRIFLIWIKCLLICCSQPL